MDMANANELARQQMRKSVDDIKRRAEVSTRIVEHYAKRWQSVALQLRSYFNPKEKNLDPNPFFLRSYDQTRFLPKEWEDQKDVKTLPMIEKYNIRYEQGDLIIVCYQPQLNGYDFF